jgi:threonine synthase
MNYYSTNRQSPIVNFREATIKGQAPDMGLYFPETIPQLEADFFKELKNLSKAEIGFRVIRPYVGNTIPEDVLYNLVEETVNFDFPLVKITDNIYTLELFHGPTLAFKDVGARFMSRCLGQFSKQRSEKITVLVATSGDTGGAVADGFYDVDGVEVVILYPSGKVSSVQEKQLTTLGKNIRALEVKGNFDDCQSMVKKAFADEALNKKRFLTSANSINVARWLPQQFYYFYAAQQWEKIGEELSISSHNASKSFLQSENNKGKFQFYSAPVISVPSGNFGNICAGLMAYRSGLPVKHFVAACNANDVIPKYFDSQKLQPSAAIATISNAMDVGNPSNFVRILEIFNQEFGDLKDVMSSYSFTDEQTKEEMLSVHKQLGYTLDPHGAVGLLGLKKYISESGPWAGYFLETAHPVKFYDVVEPVLGEKVEVPESIKGILTKEKKSTLIEAEYEALRDLLY